MRNSAIEFRDVLGGNHSHIREGTNKLLSIMAIHVGEQSSNAITV